MNDQPPDVTFAAPGKPKRGALDELAHLGGSVGAWAGAVIGSIIGSLVGLLVGLVVGAISGAVSGGISGAIWGAQLHRGGKPTTETVEPAPAVAPPPPPRPQHGRADGLSSKAPAAV